jgi:hypothetical protein
VTGRSIATVLLVIHVSTHATERVALWIWNIVGTLHVANSLLIVINGFARNLVVISPLELVCNWLRSHFEAVEVLADWSNYYVCLLLFVHCKALLSKCLRFGFSIPWIPSIQIISSLKDSLRALGIRFLLYYNPLNSLGISTLVLYNSFLLINILRVFVYLNSWSYPLWRGRLLSMVLKHVRLVAWALFFGALLSEVYRRCLGINRVVKTLVFGKNKVQINALHVFKLRLKIDYPAW